METEPSVEHNVLAGDPIGVRFYAQPLRFKACTPENGGRHKQGAGPQGQAGRVSPAESQRQRRQVQQRAENLAALRRRLAVAHPNMPPSLPVQVLLASMAGSHTTVQRLARHLADGIHWNCPCTELR